MAGYPLHQVSKHALAAAEAKTIIDANVYNLNTP
jgi:hypothetical protein